MRWNSEERAFAVEAYFSSGCSVIATQRAFRNRFNLAPLAPVPDRKSIVTWVTTFRQTASATKRRTGVPRPVRSPENIEAVRASMLRSPRRSARKHASALRLSDRSVRRILRDDLHFHPYKMAIKLILFWFYDFRYNIMATILGSLSLDILAIILTILIGWYTYFKWCFKYWERKGIPYTEPTFPFGSLIKLFAVPKAFAEQCQDAYTTAKAKGHKHLGVYTFAAPMYIPIDIELVRNIIQKDFDHFVDRGIYFNEVDDPLSANLFFVEGSKWKNLRVKLTPTFTSGKMKMMFPTLVECGRQLKGAMDIATNKSEPIDIKDFAACFTMNIIGSCAFGIECNCFKEKNSEFIKNGKRIFVARGLEFIKAFIGFASPSLARRLRFALFPKEAANFFMKITKETVDYRERNNVVRKDFMQLLIDMKNSVKDDTGKGIGLTIEDLAAQTFVFFVAGYETSSTTMTFCLFELASNPDIQQKVREEIEEVLARYNGEINYDALAEMKYMGQVIDETLRKYPPLAFLNRKCVIPYKIPDTDVVIDKETAVIISTLGIQRDPEYFLDPEKFDPDRFSEENKSKIKPFTYLPFGDGPRVCLGLRFGVMQTKVGLTVLLRNYKFSLNHKTKTPLKMDPYSYMLSVEGDIWLNAEKLEK
ncbi:hypothetical protein ILUMI_07205 [Ignelater luminosus]|uniref:DUF4817 domain-containing protein n=1 Tax=Ignelater luminosus TaxID=2038154 RepID=A0A8K0D6X4_IGNLU|nr:hypothetical protein ILUMI_07205 [Ignelater luminosus]